MLALARPDKNPFNQATLTTADQLLGAERFSTQEPQEGVPRTVTALAVDAAKHSAASTVKTHLFIDSPGTIGLIVGVARIRAYRRLIV
ncbi:hypothetical protein [Paraburkholderia sediminicola]|uniref:hypothetical protein n=1 Tax=Paraburkholderia sediminicola TaxID=458836 RepID=UPI0038BDD9EA